MSHALDFLIDLYVKLCILANGLEMISTNIIYQTITRINLVWPLIFLLFCLKFRAPWYSFWMLHEIRGDSGEAANTRRRIVPKLQVISPWLPLVLTCRFNPKNPYPDWYHQPNEEEARRRWSRRSLLFWSIFIWFYLQLTYDFVFWSLVGGVEYYDGFAASLLSNRRAN